MLRDGRVHHPVLDEVGRQLIDPIADLIPSERDGLADDVCVEPFSLRQYGAQCRCAHRPPRLRSMLVRPHAAAASEGAIPAVVMAVIGVSTDNISEATDMLRAMMVMEPQRALMLGQLKAVSDAEITARARSCAALFLNGCSSAV